MLLLLPYIWLVHLCVLNMAYSLYTVRAIYRLDVQGTDRVQANVV